MKYRMTYLSFALASSLITVLINTNNLKGVHLLVKHPQTETLMNSEAIWTTYGIYTYMNKWLNERRNASTYLATYPSKKDSWEKFLQYYVFLKYVSVV